MAKKLDSALCNFFALLITIFPVGCESETLPPNVNSKAGNIILFIGDGMGAEHRKAARWNSVGDKGVLSMDDMPIHGWSRTRSANNFITDSAAAATAMASGVKTNNGVIGLDANLKFVSTILEEAKSRGKMVGLVTTTQITHATPAAFAAHVADRDLMMNILLSMK